MPDCVSFVFLPQGGNGNLVALNNNVTLRNEEDRKRFKNKTNSQRYVGHIIIKDNTTI